MDKARYKLLASEVERILFEDWDPIGVNELGGPLDEYASYAPVIVRLLGEGASADTIVAHLAKIESEQMGVSSPPEHNAMVVNKLLSACLG